jgi:fermentation-respiration switch protein FrsA (DUF1100 family)
MKRPVLLATVALVAGVLLVSVPVRAQIHQQIYPAPTAPLDPSVLPPGAVIDTVRTADGLTLKGAEIAPRDGKPTFLVLHGNGSAATRSMAWLAPLIAEGYGVVAADYREYSGNPGKASEAGLAADADAFYARARAVAGGGKVIVVGHSLGGGVAFGLARRQKLDALVTIGTFTDLRTMAPAAVRWMIADRYDNIGAVPKLDEPYYLIHGTADEVIPFAHGEALRRAAGAAHRTGAMFTISSAGHSPDGADIAAILRAVAAETEGGGAVAQAQLPRSIQLTPF